MTDTITLPREVVQDALEALAKTPCNSVYEQDCTPCNAEEALRTALAAEQPKPEPVAKAWAEGYQQGVKDERTSEASIGIAGFGAKVEPARQNPYGTALAAEPTKPEPVAYFDLQKQVFYWARPTMIDVPMTIALEPLPLYTAPPATHPGYVIGSHWLETAYSRICAGEAEADVLRDIGLVREEAFLTGVAHLKAENERLREALNRFEYSSDGHIKRYPEEEEVIAALRREET